MMKSELPATTGFLHYDESPLPAFAHHATASGDSEQILQLKVENARLQRLVAELLVKNQELRQRHCGARRDAECAESSAVPRYLRREN
jgi:hypothetical protein